MVKGARHRRLDNLEDMRTQSIMFAHLNNGKNVKKITKHIETERKAINEAKNSSDYEHKKSKAFDKRVRAVQRKALQEWLDKKQNR